ncbi:MAG TPA: Mpo1-like protein [Rhodanobacteraceae bacterium]
MRSIDDWFESYGYHHRNPINEAVHWVCVPVIMWCVIALLWVIPIPPGLPANPGSWAGLAMLAAFFFYYKLSRRMGLAMAVELIVFGLITNALFGALGTFGLLWLAVALFVLAWIGQFIGHHIEGRKPSFLTDLVYLLIGPAWLTGKLMRRLGTHW